MSKQDNDGKLRAKGIIEEPIKKWKGRIIIIFNKILWLY